MLKLGELGMNTWGETVLLCKALKNKHFIGLNIDVIKLNFSKLKTLDYQTNEARHILGYIICETNVTDFESQPFYIKGYNKCVFHKLEKSDG